jgi:hypothetical protein
VPIWDSVRHAKIVWVLRLIALGLSSTETSDTLIVDDPVGARERMVRIWLM